jgi:hypothetical protein
MEIKARGIGIFHTQSGFFTFRSFYILINTNETHMYHCFLHHPIQECYVPEKDLQLVIIVLFVALLTLGLPEAQHRIPPLHLP